MRLFVALQPSAAFLEALAVLRERLSAKGVSGRWLEPANLHLTLAFIGEWPENVTPLLPAVQAPFRLTLSHAGVFLAAKVLWAGVQPSDELDRLAGEVRRSLAEAGVPFDRQMFNPHITLARKPFLPEGISLTEIWAPPAVMTVRELCLYRSDHLENGMAYTVIGRRGAE